MEMKKCWFCDTEDRLATRDDPKGLCELDPTNRLICDKCLCFQSRHIIKLEN